jgi:hypothetical protein
MSWGDPSLITTENLDSDAGNPALAREEILAAVEQLALVCSGRSEPNGVAALDLDGQVPNTQLPAQLITPEDVNMQLLPSTGVVNIDYLLNLTPKSVAQLEALTPIPNMIALCSDGDEGEYCLAVYTGENDIDTGEPIWFKVALGARITAE